MGEKIYRAFGNPCIRSRVKFSEVIYVEKVKISSLVVITVIAVTLVNRIFGVRADWPNTTTNEPSKEDS